MERDFVLYPWVAQKGLNPVIIDSASAKGNYFYDPSGKKHLDFSSMFVFSNLGHSDPRVVEAICRQAQRLPTGAEANEGAIKVARLATGKEKIIARYRSYHGSTYGAMTLTNDCRNWACEPAVPSIIHCLDPYCYRCPFGLTYPA